MRIISRVEQPVIGAFVVSTIGRQIGAKSKGHAEQIRDAIQLAYRAGRRDKASELMAALGEGSNE